MKITKLEKETNYISNTVKIGVEITIDKYGLDILKYVGNGFDYIPDEMIPSILVAVGKVYKGKIKNGKIIEEINSIVY
jgi:hypothetical protein